MATYHNTIGNFTVSSPISLLRSETRFLLSSKAACSTSIFLFFTLSVCLKDFREPYKHLILALARPSQRFTLCGTKNPILGAVLQCQDNLNHLRLASQIKLATAH